MTKHRKVWFVTPLFDQEGNGPALGAFGSRDRAMAFGFAHVHCEGFKIRSAIAVPHRPRPTPDRMTAGE